MRWGRLLGTLIVLAGIVFGIMYWLKGPFWK